MLPSAGLLCGGPVDRTILRIADHNRSVARCSATRREMSWLLPLSGGSYYNGNMNASGKPFRPSTTAIRMSPMPRRSLRQNVKRDYARVHPLPDAVTVLQQSRWFDGYNESHPHSGLEIIFAQGVHSCSGQVAGRPVKGATPQPE
jgi:hypothetical protein